MRRIYLCLILIVFSINNAFAYGEEGHRIVGKIADFRIKSSHAKDKVQSLLLEVHAESLADIANWADDVKYQRHPKDSDDAETVSFISQHPSADTGAWHFVDLPFGMKKYDTNISPKFTPPNDVVHTLNHCIARLQGTIEPEFPISEVNALRFLVHLSGDIHQPFHVVSGYIDDRQPDPALWITGSPEKAEMLGDDAGGNRLILPSKEKMHSFFDVDLVKAVIRTATERDTALKLSKRHIKNNGKMNGNPGTWPAQWADDTLLQGRKVYKTIKMVSKRMPSDHPPGWNIIELPTEEVFVLKNTSATSAQLAKAGARLAAILDAIWPD